MSVGQLTASGFEDLSAEMAAALVSYTADVAMIIDPSGVIVEVATSEAEGPLTILRKWVGTPWRATVTSESQSKIKDLLTPDLPANARWRQVNHALPEGGDLPVQYKTFTLAGDGRCLAIGRDLRLMSEIQQRLFASQQAMEKDYERFRHAETRFRLLFQLAGEAMVVVNALSGKIVEVNSAACEHIGRRADALVGTVYQSIFSPQSAAGLQALTDRVRATGEGDDVAVRLYGNDGQQGERFLVTASLFSEGGESFYLMRLRPGTEQGSDLLVPKSSATLLDALHDIPDGFVVTDASGVILSVNPAFLEMVQLVTEAQVIGQPLQRWLNQPGLSLRTILSGLQTQGRLKLLSTVLTGEYGLSMNVEISGVWTERPEGVSCFCFVMRDAERRMISAPSIDQDLKGSVEHMTELVGKVSLRDIVRETTDVIERLCIEAALKITQDNRASAAEMLGLSRQSLYVKMRRFNIGSDVTQDVAE